MYEAFSRLRDDDAFRVGIVTAAGDRVFSAGWDLKAAAAGERIEADHGPGGFAGLTELTDLGKPVIAAVNGLALGGGFELVLAADLVVAADHSEFALTEATLGLVADSGGVLRLPKRLPRAIALEYPADRAAAHRRRSGDLGPGQPGGAAPRASARRSHSG